LTEAVCRGRKPFVERRPFFEGEEAVCGERPFVEGGGCSSRERGDRSSNAGGGRLSGGGHLLRGHSSRLFVERRPFFEGGRRLFVERPFVKRGGR